MLTKITPMINELFMNENTGVWPYSTVLFGL